MRQYKKKNDLPYFLNVTGMLNDRLRPIDAWCRQSFGEDNYFLGFELEEGKNYGNYLFRAMREEDLVAFKLRWFKLIS